MKLMQILLNLLHQSEMIIIELSFSSFDVTIMCKLSKIYISSWKPLGICQVFIETFSLV